MTNSLEHSNRAILQVRSSETGDSPRQIPCQVEAAAGKRLNLTCSDRVRVSTAVSVEYNDTLLLGEIVACTQDCDQTWRIELKIEQILTGLQSLILLRERLLGESVSPQMNPFTAVAARR